MYHLVDEVKGTAVSSIIVESFEYFQELKDYIVTNTKILYDYIPNMEKFPDYSGCRSFTVLKSALEKNNYGNWRLTIHKSEDKKRKYRHVNSNITNKQYITIRPLGMLKRASRLDNGIHCKVGNLLTNHEKKAVLHAIEYRVLHTTEEAVLISWVGSKGSANTWIPKTYIK